MTNSGTLTVTVGAATISGDFAQTGACPQTLQTGQSCSIAVTFTPAALGSRTGTLVIPTAAGNYRDTSGRRRHECSCKYQRHNAGFWK